MDPYYLSFSGLWKQKVLILFEQAKSEGRLKPAKIAFKNLMKELEERPASMGETVYHLKHLDLPVHHVVRMPWSLHAAIDEKRRIVYLSKIDLLS